MIYLISVFFSFIAVIFATPLLTNLLRSLEIVDSPDTERKIHTEPIPRLGGIVIYLVVSIFIIFLIPSVYQYKYFFTGSIILFLLGVADDLWNLKWNIKFLIQSFSVLFLLLYLNSHSYFHFNIFGIELPFNISVPLMFMLILGAINAFNLLDGLDGLVSGFSLIIASLSFVLSYGSHSHFVPLLSILIIGVTLGFLKFNSNPANIFLGDSGSLILAYFTLTILLSAAAGTSSSSVDVVFIGIVLSVPLIDTFRVMITRMINGRSPFLPDKNHIHHIILSRKIRHKTTVFIILSLSVISVLIGLYYNFSSKAVGFILFALFAVFLLLIDKVLDFILEKDNLIFYGKLIKSLPLKLAKIFKFYILPFVAFAVFSFLFYILFSKAALNDKRFIYFLLFNTLTIVYVLINLKNRNYISELFVFVNFVLFFFTMNSDVLFYKLYSVPIIKFVNINQSFIILMVPVLIFFFLFRDKLTTKRSEGFLSGLDLIIALFIVSNYLFIKLSGFTQDYYKFSDIMIRSFLVYLLYKIVVECFPKFRFQLYFTSFAFVIIALLRIILF